jgi:hypothetical protein
MIQRYRALLDRIGVNAEKFCSYVGFCLLPPRPLPDENKEKQATSYPQEGNCAHHASAQKPGNISIERRIVDSSTEMRCHLTVPFS